MRPDLAITICVIATAFLTVLTFSLVRVARQRDYFQRCADYWYSEWKKERREAKELRDEADWWKR